MSINIPQHYKQNLYSFFVSQALCSNEHCQWLKFQHSQKKASVTPLKDDLSVYYTMKCSFLLKYEWEYQVHFYLMWLSSFFFHQDSYLIELSLLPVTLSFIFFPDLLLWQLNTKHCTLYTSRNICMETLPNNFNWAKDCQWHCVMSCNVPWDIPHFNLGHKKCIRVHFTTGGCQT